MSVMLDLTERVNEMMITIRMREHEVMVLGLRSWWRRWFKREVWAIVTKSAEGDISVRGLNGEMLKRFGHMRRVDDPDQWPDEVCVAVAAWRLTHG